MCVCVCARVCVCVCVCVCWGQWGELRAGSGTLLPREQYRAGLVFTVSLYCASKILHFSYIEGVWQLCREQAHRAAFPAAFAPLVSLRRISVILAIFQTLSLLYL